MPKYICHCSSYAFPHRVGCGRCACTYELPAYRYKPGDKGPGKVSDLCESCGQPADLVEMDFGIGAYEFWGSPGVDVNIQVVTACCEASTVPNSRAEHVKHKWNVIK